MEQFFIKISPNKDLVNCGKLINTTTKTLIDYHVNDAKSDNLEQKEALDWIKASLQKKSIDSAKVLFFIHGFWGSLPYALNRTSQEFKKSYFKTDTSKVIAIIHILWNANDVLYKQSIKNLNESTKSLATLFNNIELLPFRYSLLCHSMGNRFLHETLVSHKINVYFEELVLMAPDLAYKKFVENPSLFSSLANFTTVFFHAKDKTLKMSKGINKIERLGRLNKSEESTSIKFIDCTEIKDIDTLSDSVMKHLYFLTSKTVKRQIDKIFNN